MANSKFRTAYAYDPKEASDQAVAWTDPGESMTVLSQAEDADINVLMKRYGITGQMPTNPKVPMYGDFTGITDYASALQSIQKANEGFAEFPAEIRSKFENNPQLMLEFLANPQNRSEAESLGLVKRADPPIAPPPATPVAAPAVAKPAATP